MELYAFNSPYSEVFDPYFVYAENIEQAKSKIREAYPIQIFNIYKLTELPRPGLGQKLVKGIHVLNFVETLR